MLLTLGLLGLALFMGSEALAQRPLKWRKPSATPAAEAAPSPAVLDEDVAEEATPLEEAAPAAGSSARSVRLQLAVDGDNVQSARVRNVSHNEPPRDASSAPPAATKIRAAGRRTRYNQAQDEQPVPRRRATTPRLAAPADEEEEPGIAPDDAGDETPVEEMPADETPTEVEDVPAEEEPVAPPTRPQRNPSRRQPGTLPPDDDERDIRPMDDETDGRDSEEPATDVRARPREDEECRRLRSAALAGSLLAISVDITEPGKTEADISYRHWRKPDGTQVEARFERLDGDVVVLKPRKGDLIRIPRSRLSKHEQRRIVRLPPFCEVGGPAVADRCFSPLTYTWKASCLCHKPLYFEQIQLERYGHDAGPIVQPFISGAHFFGGVLLLPYSMGIEPPQECVYALGYYRPGDCAPYMIPPFPLSLRAAAIEGGVIAGGILLIP